MKRDDDTGPFVPKFRFEERKLAKLLHYFESDPSAHSRQNSFYYMKKVGFRRLPLKDDAERLFYRQAGIERGLINETGSLFLAGDKPNTGAFVGVELTQAGYDFLENARASGFWVSNFRQLKPNFLTIIISVATAVFTSWAIYYAGAPDDRPPPSQVETSP